MIALLAFAMRSVRGKIAAVENKNYCDNLLWQSRLTLSFLELMTSGYNRTCTEGHDSFGVTMVDAKVRLGGQFYHSAERRSQWDSHRIIRRRIK